MIDTPRRPAPARVLGVLALASVIGGCQGELQVEIETAVGGRGHREDPRARLQDVKAVAQALLRPGADADAAPVTATAGPARPPTTAAELEELTRAIRKGPIDEIAGPARRIAAAPPSLWPQIHAALLAPRRAPKGDYRSMLAAIGGDVPNRYGHFDLAWKKAHGFSVKRSEDWFEDLLVLPRSKLSPVLAPVYRDCVLQTALLRASSEIAKNPQVSTVAVNALLDAAFVHEGTFRDEVSRAIQRVGDEAVAALVRATNVGDDPDEDAQRRAEYAAAQLDRMDRWIPDRAEAALRTEPRRLAAVIEAWGEARNGNAAAAILAHADARVPAVRAAARRAFTGLVEGPPPKTISRRVRLLGGGTGQAQAFLNYRQRAAIAVREALVHVDPAAIERPCDPPIPDKPIDPQCEGQPARHTAAYFAKLDEVRQAESRTAIDRAMSSADPDRTLDELDRLLAERPELGEEPRVAQAYRHGAARALRRGDALRAAALSRKSAVLLQERDPALGDTLRLQALLAEADSGVVDAWGRQMLLRTAAALRPDDPHVADALAATPAAAFTGTTDGSDARIAAGSACIVVAFACLGGIGHGLRRRRGLG